MRQVRLHYKEKKLSLATSKSHQRKKIHDDDDDDDDDDEKVMIRKCDPILPEQKRSRIG